MHLNPVHRGKVSAFIFVSLPTDFTATPPFSCLSLVKNKIFERWGNN